MSRRAWVQTGLLTCVLLLGLAGGLLLSFEVWPASCEGASPVELTLAGKYRWLAAAAGAYSYDQNLVRARQRLSVLGEEGPRLLCALAAGGCDACTKEQSAAGRLLAVALGIECGLE